MQPALEKARYPFAFSELLPVVGAFKAFTWTDYVKQRFGFSPQHAHRLMQAKQLAAASPMGDKPKTEREARARKQAAKKSRSSKVESSKVDLAAEFDLQAEFKGFEETLKRWENVLSRQDYRKALFQEDYRDLRGRIVKQLDRIVSQLENIASELADLATGLGHKAELLRRMAKEVAEYAAKSGGSPPVLSGPVCVQLEYESTQAGAQADRLDSLKRALTGIPLSGLVRAPLELELTKQTGSLRNMARQLKDRIALCQEQEAKYWQLAPPPQVLKRI